MKGFILNIYDFLSSHKGLAALILGIVVGFCGLSASRLTFNEDITDFLPQREEVKGQEKMAVLFEGGTLEEKLDAMYAFDLAWDMPGADADMFSVNPSPARIDSLLSVPGYIDKVLEEDKVLLMSPNPVLSNYVRQDPLRLNSSAPKVRIEDGYLFTQDGETGIIFFDSPYGGSESSRNAALLDSLNAVKAAVQAEYPSVHIYSTGGPEVAVENTVAKLQTLPGRAVDTYFHCLRSRLRPWDNCPFPAQHIHHNPWDRMHGDRHCSELSAALCGSPEV